MGGCLFSISECWRIRLASVLSTGYTILPGLPCAMHFVSSLEN